MSLQEDLQQNRKIFEQLTAMPREQALPQVRQIRKVDEIPQAAQPQKMQADIRASEKEAARPAFSLYSEDPQIHAEAFLTAEPQYPALQAPQPAQPEDPIIAMYERIASEARRFSQPMSEEEAF